MAALPMKGTTPWNSYESTEQYDSLFPLLPDYVAHYTLGGEFSPQIGLPDKHSLHLSKKIIVALISDRLRITTAYAEKRYPAEISESRWLGLTDRIDQIFQYGRSRLGSYVSLGLDLPKKEGSYEDLSMQFFFRNVAALDASKRLAELGYLCEVAVILRTALEQFAFCASLWPLSGSEDLRTLRPLHALSPFKKFVPASGRLYGLLSRYAHFEYDHHTHFFEHSEGGIFTIQRGSILRAYSTHLLLVTMACVAKYVLQVAPRQFQEVPASVQELSKFLEQINRYSDDVCMMLGRDVVLAKLDLLLQDVLR